jgi:hypothetical protein
LAGAGGVYRRNDAFTTQKCSVKIHPELPDKDCPQQGKVSELQVDLVIRIFVIRAGISGWCASMFKDIGVL